MPTISDLQVVGLEDEAMGLAVTPFQVLAEPETVALCLTPKPHVH